jgi:hypothetical protein
LSELAREVEAETVRPVGARDCGHDGGKVRQRFPSTGRTSKDLFAAGPK